MPLRILQMFMLDLVTFFLVPSLLQEASRLVFVFVKDAKVKR